MKATLLFLLVSAAFALSSAKSVEVTTKPSKPIAEVAVDKNGVEPAFVDGVDLNKLTEEELIAFFGAEDEIFSGELDIAAYLNSVAAKGRRPKRWIPLAARAVFVAGRALLRSASRGRITRSGTRLTRQYNKPGSYSDAVRDFRSLSPSGTKSFSNSKLQGMTGNVGRHRVTVRSSSSNGSPTLEIRTTRGGGSTVRKVRYNRQ